MENNIEGVQSQEVLPIEQQAQLALEMLQAFENRHAFFRDAISSDKIEMAKYMLEHLKELEQFDRDYKQKKENFDQQVPDKKAVIDFLKEKGDTENAEKVERGI